MQTQVEHPAEFRTDARFGRFGLTQMIAAICCSVLTLVAALIMTLAHAGFGKTILVILCGGALTVQILYRVTRLTGRLFNYALRPKLRRADATQPITVAGESTVQDLLKVVGCEGPFIQMADGYVGMIMRIDAPPTESLTPMQSETMRARWQLALKAAAEANIELAIYCDVEPDLIRPELEREQRQAERWPPGSGIRALLEARIEHHRRLSAVVARHMVYHLRLAVRPADVPLAHKPTSPEDYMEQVINHLATISTGMAAELSSVGLQVRPLSPEATRDLAARQLDPDGWRAYEPARGTDWAWPVDGQPAMLQAPPISEPAFFDPNPVAPDPDPAFPPVIPAPVTPVPASMVPPLPTEPVIAPTATITLPQPVDTPLKEIAADPIPVTIPVPDSPSEQAEERKTHWLRRPPARPHTETATTQRPLSTREVLAVIGADRRVGTSTVALNLALALRSRGNSVCTVLLDAGRNDISTWIGSQVLVSNHDWVRGGPDLTLPGPRGTIVIPGPTRLPGSPYQPMTTETVTRVLGQARREADVVVLDLGSEITGEQRATLEQATAALIVATPDQDWALIEQRVQLALAQGLKAETIAIVLNRADGTRPRRQVELLLPEDDTVPECRRIGAVPVIADPGSPWTVALLEWASRL